MVEIVSSLINKVDSDELNFFSYQLIDVVKWLNAAKWLLEVIIIRLFDNLINYIMSIKSIILVKQEFILFHYIKRRDFKVSGSCILFSW